MVKTPLTERHIGRSGAPPAESPDNSALLAATYPVVLLSVVVQGLTFVLVAREMLFDKETPSG